MSKEGKDSLELEQRQKGNEEQNVGSEQGDSAIVWKRFVVKKLRKFIFYTVWILIIIFSLKSLLNRDNANLRNCTLGEGFESTQTRQTIEYLFVLQNLLRPLSEQNTTLDFNQTDLKT